MEEVTPLDTVPFRPDGPRVTRVGLGGEGILRTSGRSPEAVEVIEAALWEGITYFDSAPAYAQCEDYHGRVWPRHPEARGRVVVAGKSASRDREGALRDLHRSLQRMGTDRLDLWQIHDLRTREDLRAIEAPGGALEAFVEARSSGKVGAIGVTGHHDPRVLTHAVVHWPVDAVLLPVNPVEAILGGFLDVTLEAARDKGLVVLGMKVLGGGEYLAPGSGVTAEALIRFALSQPISVAVVGCGDPREVQALASCGRGHVPMTRDEQEALLDIFRPYARKLAFYRGR